MKRKCSYMFCNEMGVERLGNRLYCVRHLRLVLDSPTRLYAQKMKGGKA